MGPQISEFHGELSKDKGFTYLTFAASFPFTDMIQARNLQVYNITSRSLHLTWSRLEGDTGHYTVTSALTSQPQVTSKMSLYEERGAVIGDLRPNTSYEISFIPESNMQYIQLQTIELTTLPGKTPSMG